MRPKSALLWLLTSKCAYRGSSWVFLVDGRGGRAARLGQQRRRTATKAARPALSAAALAASREVADRRTLQYVHLGSRPVRVWCLSDLHTDYRDNLAWVESWSKGDPGWVKPPLRDSFDVLVLAGDVSSSLRRARETLRLLKCVFDEVVVVPGNHDVWANAAASARGQERSSIRQLLDFLDICKDLNVRTDPVCFKSGGTDLWLVPLMSWYHASWDKEPDLPAELQHRNGDFLRRWGDFRRCVWPDVCSTQDFVSINSTSTALSDFFAGMNDDMLTAVTAEVTACRSEGRRPVVISLSHFVPRQELCPEKRFLLEPALPKVIGSDALERQVRRLSPNVHVFGHSHIPIDMAVDGTRYLQWCLGSPREQTRQCCRMREIGPLLLFTRPTHLSPLPVESQSQQQQQQPTSATQAQGGRDSQLLFAFADTSSIGAGSGSSGFEAGFAPLVTTLWGRYYSEHPRDATRTEVPEYAMALSRRRGSGSLPPGSSFGGNDDESSAARKSVHDAGEPPA